MDPRAVAEAALEAMRQQGFDDAMVEASMRSLAELNVAHNEPTLMRGALTHKVALTGIVDGRRASTELADIGSDAIRRAAAELLAAARSAPRDDANAVSADQQAVIDKGPAEPDRDAIAAAMAEMLDWRAAHAPTVVIEEAQASHQRSQAHLLTTRGTVLDSRVGWYELSMLASAREGERTSSFNFGGGQCDDFAGTPPAERFGLRQIFADLARQVHARPITAPFDGDVVLTPRALESLLGWLRAQLSDLQLIAGTSLYADRLGTQIASPLITLQSRFDAPGITPLSADGFVARPVTLLREGRLEALMPSLYAARKTGRAHVPTAATGWELAAGDTSLDDLIAGVPRGAIVGRLSMGAPASNGDFSGVIKNSFLVGDGNVDHALAEVMISGNVARMLEQVHAVSRQRLDTGAALLPWVRIGGLHFS